MADGTVYVVGDDTYVRALAAADGAERWRVKLDDRVWVNVSVAAGTVLTGSVDGTVVALNTDDGGERWHHRLPHPTGGDQERPGTVDTDGSRVYVTRDEALRVLSADTGASCWEAREYRGSYASGVAVADGRVYAPTAEGRADGFGTFDAASGDRLATWGGERDYPPGFGPAVAGGAVYATGRGALCRYE